MRTKYFTIQSKNVFQGWGCFALKSFTRTFQNIFKNISPGERGCCEEITFWAHSPARDGAYTDGQVSPTVFTKTLRSTIQCQRKQEYVPTKIDAEHYQ